MSKGRKLAIAAVALAVFGLIISASLKREPTYKGLTIHEWLQRKESDPQANEALCTLGTNNLQLLVDRLGYEEKRYLLYRLYAQLPAALRYRPITDFASRRGNLADEASQVLYRLGTNVAPVAPQLQRIAGHEGHRALRAMVMLGNLGDTGIAMVASAAISTNVNQRLYAVGVLSALVSSKVAREALEKAADDPAPAVQRVASDSLRNYYLRDTPLPPQILEPHPSSAY